MCLTCRCPRKQQVDVGSLERGERERHPPDHGGVRTLGRSDKRVVGHEHSEGFGRRRRDGPFERRELARVEPARLARVGAGGVEAEDNEAVDEQPRLQLVAELSPVPVIGIGEALDRSRTGTS